PPQTIAISSYLNFRFFDFGGILKLFSPLTGITEWNLLNTPWVFIIPSLFAAGLRSGLFILIFRQFFKGMPRDLEEAAKIDGCGALKTFIRVMIPLSIPAYITVLLFSFIWHWNDLYSSSMFFTLEIRPLSVMLNGLLSSLKDSGVIDSAMTTFEMRSYMQAGAFLTILPPLIIYIFTQRYFTESIERTGIVG
ncbi:MAG TPA: carbohydrate ABC transporter permease, partial [Ruminococcaceae bacterium]|nr:carbohydrate ABC transporter permease [Oscillospiraceae bacterium]